MARVPNSKPRAALALPWEGVDPKPSLAGTLQVTCRLLSASQAACDAGPATGAWLACCWGRACALPMVGGVAEGVLLAQDVFNLLPNLGVEELSRSFAVQSNDMMLAIYLASLTRSVLALHSLIDNKARARRALPLSCVSKGLGRTATPMAVQETRALSWAGKGWTVQDQRGAQPCFA